ncbi:hypothetical protein BSKO_09513 [Bryopsis sp. KO-2023]|nr:hypothetical protein BSKO_09513 [Bryopsis sp. KO-2023]
MPRGRKDSKTEGAQMDSLYNSDDFRMYCFKVLPCSKHYCHDWTECPFAHPGEKARRRDPRVFPHVGIECPQGASCPRGDLCPFAHNVFECWLHPTRYRTQLCNEPASCRRKVCFFAHTVEELREPTGGMEQVVDPTTGAAVAAANLNPSAGIDQQAAAAAAAAATAANLVDAAPPVTAPANGTTMPPRPSRSSIDSNGTWRSNKSKASAKEGGQGQETQAAVKRASMDSNRSAKQSGRMSADIPRNGQRSQSASFDGKKAKSKGPGRLSVDIPRMARQQKQQEQESASATAAQLQSLRNEIQAQQLGVSTSDLSAALEQLSLTSLSADQIAPQQIQQLQQQALQNQAAGANLSQNDRVVQLFMMLLKEITDSRTSQPQPTDFQAQRTSLDSAFSVGSGVPSERFSMDGFVPMPYNMHYGGGLADATRNLYMAPPGNGRVSMDGVPDFILHDSRARDPSLDSTISDTMGMQNVARMSIDSGYESSVVSGGSSEQRCLSVDGGLATLNMAAPPFNPSSFVDPFTRTTAPLTTAAVTTGTASFDGYPGVSIPQGVTAPMYAQQFDPAAKPS